MIIITVAFVLSYLLGRPIRWMLVRLAIVDHPNARSSHDNPTPRGGGLTILITIFIMLWGIARGDGLSPFVVELALATIALAVVSFVDDFRSLRPWVRFVCQGLAAVSVFTAMGWPALRLELVPEYSVVLPASLGGGLALFWIIGYTNAFNFMDGINGIAAGQGVLTGLGTALIGGTALGDFRNAPVFLGFAIAGASAGFIPHNFSKARMFLGDVGSAPLGFLLAVLVLWLGTTVGWWLLVPLTLLHANFILDTGITLLRRLVRREPICCPHREHFYQRLIRTGKSHAFVTTIEMVLQAGVLGLLLLCYLHTGTLGRVILAGAIIALWLVFFAWAELCFREIHGRQFFFDKGAH